MKSEALALFSSVLFLDVQDVLFFVLICVVFLFYCFL